MYRIPERPIILMRHRLETGLGADYRLGVATSAGRPRDTDLDAAILDAARSILVERGVDGLSFAAVAARAGTTRPAIYRRFDDVDTLAVAAIASLSAAAPPIETDDPYADLIAELRSFQRGITSVHGLALAGAVLAGTTSPSVAAAYRATVVAPRRQRLRAVFDRASEAGLIVATPSERARLVAMCTGSWYGHALAGDRPGRNWGHRHRSRGLAGRPGPLTPRPSPSPRAVMAG